MSFMENQVLGYKSPLYGRRASQFKIEPAGDEKTTRKSIYKLSDFMFRFWYSFVRPDLSRISMGFGKTVCSEVFDKSNGKLETYMDPVFEECALQFLWREMEKSKNNYKTIGRWWGANPKEKKEEEIDILALDSKGAAYFCEYKWKNLRSGNDILDDLIRKSNLLSKYTKKNICYFLNPVLQPDWKKQLLKEKILG